MVLGVGRRRVKIERKRREIDVRKLIWRAVGRY